MELEQLQEALLQLSRENAALKAVNRYSDNPVVVVRHSGHGPQLVIGVDGEDPVILDPNGVNSVATIPLAAVVKHQKNTDWFSLGYLYVDGELDNPNLIINAEEWVAQRSEDQIAEDVGKITSHASLNFLYDYTEGKRSPKALTLRDACARRMEELFNIVVVEDPKSDE